MDLFATGIVIDVAISVAALAVIGAFAAPALAIVRRQERDDR